MKTITTLVFIIGFSILSFSQQNRDKIKTLKIAYITEKLDLSQKEAQKFWPIYNNFEDNHSKFRKQSFEMRKGIDFETLKEEDAIVLLKEMQYIDIKKRALKSNFIDNLLKVIPARKIILLEKIEDDFKRKMFEEYKSRRNPNQDQKK